MRTANINLKINVDDSQLQLHSRFLKDLVAILKATSIEGTKVTEGVKKVNSTFMDMTYVITRASAVVRSIGYLINELFDGLQKAAERIDLQNTLGNQFENLEDKVEALKYKTANMIDKETILRSMALMSSFNLPMESFGEQVELVNKMAIRTGQSVSYMMDSFARGVSRLSAPILDNLGIQVVLKDVYAEFAISVGKSTDELTKFEKQTAVTNYVLDQMKQKTEGIELQDTIAAQVRSVKNDLTEAWNDVTDFLTEGVSTFSKGWRTLFGSDLSNYIYNTKIGISEVAKELMELKKRGVEASDERFVAAKRAFDLFKQEIDFLENNKKLQEEILSLEKDRRMTKGWENTFATDSEEYKAGLALEATFKAATETKNFIKELPVELNNLVESQLDNLLAGMDSKLKGPAAEQVKTAWKKYIAELVALSPMVAGAGFGDLMNYILQQAPKKLEEFAAKQKEQSAIGAAKQALFTLVNEEVVNLSNNLISAAENQKQLLSGVLPVKVAYEDLEKQVSSWESKLKDLQKEQLKFAAQDTEEGQKQAKKVSLELMQMTQKIAKGKQELGILHDKVELEKKNTELMKDSSVFANVVRAASTQTLKAMEAQWLGKKSLIDLEADHAKAVLAVVDAQTRAAEATLTLGDLMAKAFNVGVTKEKEAELKKALDRIEAIQAEIARRKPKGGIGATEESEYEKRWKNFYKNLDVVASEFWEKQEQKKKFKALQEELGILLDKMETTKNVEEINKLYLAYVNLQEKARELNIDLVSIFPTQDQEIRGLWEHANALFRTALAYESAGKSASMYRSIMGDFIGSDWQAGLSQFTDSMFRLSEAFKNQGDSYDHLAAGVGVIQSFTNTLIKDKKKLAWVNMVFEAAQAWSAWATFRYQQAIAHSTAAVTFGLIAGGVLKLPSGASSVNSPETQRNIPPITIIVKGDIAQTEADRGVLVQNALDEARRMGRI